MEITWLIIVALCLLAALLAVLISKVENFDDDDCEHKNTFTFVDNTAATCETTTITCLNCKKQLSKSKTDCR